MKIENCVCIPIIPYTIMDYRHVVLINQKWNQSWKDNLLLISVPVINCCTCTEFLTSFIVN